MNFLKNLFAVKVYTVRYELLAENESDVYDGSTVLRARTRAGALRLARRDAVDRVTYDYQVLHLEVSEIN